MSGIAVPCPRCGHALVEDWAKSAVHCGCGYRFFWLSPPESEIPKSRNFALSWFWLAVWGFVLFAKLWPIESGWSALLLFAIIFAGGFLVRRMVIATARAISRRRYNAWLSSDDAKRYHEYQRKREAADEARRRAEENARKAEQERIRCVLAAEARKREYLLGLSPQAFEEHVGKLFSALGYNVRLTQKSNDEGVDLYLEKNGRRAIVQCKHYTRGNVSRPDIQQTYGVLRHKRASEAFIVTTGGFTRQAIEFTEGKPMHLIDLTMLMQMAETAFTEDFIRSGPIGKMRSSRH